jgi:cell division protein FtsB
MRRSRSTHQDVRLRRRQVVTYALAVGAFVLFVNAIVGDNGYLAAIRTGREHAELTQTVEKLRQDNDKLHEQIQRIKEDPAALEEAARRDLNLIRPGETLVIIRDARPAAQTPAPAPGK